MKFLIDNLKWVKLHAYLFSNFIICYLQYIFFLFLIFITDKSKNKKVNQTKDFDAVFLERAFHGKFKKSKKIDHVFLARKALRNSKNLAIRVFSFDIVAGFLKNSFFWLRFYKILMENKYKFRIFIYFSIQNLEYLNPLIIAYICRIKESHTIALVTDGAWTNNKKALKFYDKYFDFISFWDEYDVREKFSSKLINASFSPFPKQIIKKPSLNRKYDVFFVGRTNGRPYRREAILKLKNSILKCYFNTEVENYYLSKDEYYYLMGQSKIVLSFNGSKNSTESVLQLKGRTFEALLCGCLLFESSKGQTEKLFKKGKDYLTFSNLEELVEQVHVLVKGYDTDGLRIAYNGHKKAIENFTGENYWDLIFRASDYHV